MMAAVTWLLSHGWRQLLGAAVMLALIIGVLVWKHSVYQDGYDTAHDECVAAAAAAQTAADKKIQPINQQAELNDHILDHSLQGYLNAYHQTASPVAGDGNSGCAPLRLQRDANGMYIRAPQAGQK